MNSFFDNMNLIMAFLFSLLEDIAELVTSHIILAFSLAVTLLAIVTKFFKRLFNGK